MPELPQRHLLDRLQDAAVVADATITNIDPPGFTLDQHDGLWATTHLAVNDTLKREARLRPLSFTSPRPSGRPGTNAAIQEGTGGGLSVAFSAARKESGTLPAGSLIATDAADFQEKSRAGRIKQLLAALE